MLLGLIPNPKPKTHRIIIRHQYSISHPIIQSLFIHISLTLRFASSKLRARSSNPLSTMASSLCTYHSTMILSQKTKPNHLSSSLFSSSSSLGSLSSDTSLRFFRPKQSPSPPPRRLGVVAMAPPKAKPGGKAKKGSYNIYTHICFYVPIHTHAHYYIPSGVFFLFFIFLISNLCFWLYSLYTSKLVKCQAKIYRKITKYINYVSKTDI